MVTKTMDQRKTCGEPVETNCQGCSHKHNCQETYQKLANFKGFSVVLKVIVAFLLPIMVFIASLAAFERILAEAIYNRQLQTILSFLLALPVTFAVILFIKVINGKR